jgi:subtilase family serine protease
MTSLTGAPAAAAPGTSFSVSSTVANATGGAAASAFTVGFYLSADGVITASDTSIGSRSVASLAAGSTSSGATTVTVPAGLAPGIYYLGAIADSAGQVSESSEVNNAIVGSQILVGPDLTMTSLTGAPASVLEGGGFTLASTVAASAGGAVGAFAVGFYLSPDNIITGTDTLIGTRAVASLAAGGTSTAPTAVVVPASLAPGSYYVGAIADFTGQVAEASEANNAIVAAGQIQVIGPDLSMTSLSAAPATIGIGDSFSVMDTVANGSGGAAAGPFQVGYYLSTDGTIVTSDILIGSRSVSAGLAAGQTNTATTTVTVPAGVAPATYYFGAIADYTNFVGEANEANNSIVAGLVIVGAYSCQHPATPIDDGNPCTTDSCDPVTGVLHVPVSGGTPCSDGNVCNGIELCDGGGTCRTGPPLAVDDGNPCTADSCDPVAGVSHVPAELGTLCDDGNACSYADVCNAGGACIGTPITCASDACHQRTCNGTSSCTATPLPGQSCDDGNACTYADACDVGGACVGTPVTCTADTCAQRSCNGTSSCTVAPLPGNPCDDGNPCTYGDTCSGSGACVGTPVSCASRGPCEHVQCDGTSWCAVTMLARGTACSPPETCSQVCDGVSPYCQPAE